jgi:parvulin-like peptidyl-prolyl isomerase
VCAVSLLAAIVVLGGCGGGSKNAATGTSSVASTTTATTPEAKSSELPDSEPNAVVARVAGQPITKATFARRFAHYVRFEHLAGAVPVPPEFTACIAHAEATYVPATVGAKPSREKLKSECRQQYETLVGDALNPLISQLWIIGGAAEEGVSLSEAELNAYLKRIEQGKTPAQVAETLATENKTAADFRLETRTIVLAERIRELLAKRNRHMTPAQVAAFYHSHISLYSTPARRAVEIARVHTRAEALQVKREIASGQSFASVVKHLPLPQPIYSTNGLVAAYEPGLYEEPPLNNAIFAAKPNVLSGPVGINLGYYIFEVKKLFPAEVAPLSKAEGIIKEYIPEDLYKEALREYVGAWRKRWRARTICSAGYVVSNCNGGPPASEDPYTMN